MSSDEREQRWAGWMRAAQQGDAASYEKLLDELLPHLRRFARRRLSAPDGRELVEDAVQNVLLAIHRARHTWRPERPFSPWVHAIARNAVIDTLRARGRRLSREISLEADGVAEPSVDPAASPLEQALSPELSAALDALPSNQREAVTLIHLEGLSVAEAAERVGATPGALKVRAHRGYRALRQHLERSL